MEERAAAIEAAIMAAMQNGRLAYDVSELDTAGIAGRSTTYKLIAEGKLPAVKLGRCTKILATDLLAYLQSLPVIPPKPADRKPDPRAQERGRLRHQRRAKKPERHGQKHGRRRGLRE
jgi:excisionase family DNA binding protein